MFSIIKRILRLSGKYRPRVIAGLIFNALKSCCAAFVFFAVLIGNVEYRTLNRDCHFTGIWNCCT